MKSIINSKNIGKIPLVYILLLLFIYLCPNIKFLSIGEMSSLPAFIILLTYSFLSVKEIFIFATIGILSILALLLYALNFEYPETIINSSLISFYIISVPIMLSIIFGKMFAFRFYFMSKLKIIKEIKFIIYFFVFLFAITGFLNFYLPNLLPLILFTGRTSFGRFTFFFSEPSQASSVILFIWFLSMQFLFNIKFTLFFGKKYFNFILITLMLAISTTLLSMPGTLFLQLIITFFFIFLIYSIYYLFKLLRLFFIKKIKYKSYSSLLIFKKRNLLIYFLIFLFIAVIVQNIFLKVSDSNRFDYIISQIKDLGLNQGIIAAGGFRFFYTFASFKYSFTNLISLPGNWLGTFQTDLNNSLYFFSSVPGENILQLGKNPISIKPLGWFYFCLYDLGFFGFILYIYLTLGKYLKKIFMGIIEFDFFFISVFAFQISILIIPVLPSTPCIFIPIIFVVFENFYNKKIKMVSKNF